MVRAHVVRYLWSLAILGVAVVVATPLALGRFQTWDLALVFLLATVVVAMRFGNGPAVLVAVLGVLVYDFVFVPPYFGFTFRDNAYATTYLMMIIVGITVSTLANRVREEAERAHAHERRAMTLHALSRDLAEARDVPAVVAAASRHLQAALAGRTLVWLPGPEGRGWVVTPTPEHGFEAEENEMVAARWGFEHGAPAGRGTDVHPELPSFWFPLQASTRTLGVLGFRPDAGVALDAARRPMLEALAHQVSGALERALLAEEAKATELRARTEELRNALLSSVSHDLRTPLAAVMGSASALLEERAGLTEAQKIDLVRGIYEETERLNRVVANLLAMTRVESRNLGLRRQWIPLEETVGSALEWLQPRLLGRAVTNRLGEDLPLVPMDPLLLEQVFVNLLENVARHTPPGTPLEIEARRDGDRVVVEVRDSGPGLPAGLEERVFEKFFRAPGAPAGGSGLGLAICRGIVVAHGGEIAARNRPEGGAVFCFALPLLGGAPTASEAP
jgi:two-component system sensor histidine kinase KdpD